MTERKFIPECIAVRDRSTRASGSRSWTLGEEPPFGLLEYADPLRQPELYREVIEWCDVENVYRWMPNAGRTYCNIYASDVCHVLGLYLPRQWWRRPEELRGQPAPAVQYGVNTRELGANDLHDWLVEYGLEYGWTLFFDAASMRAHMNDTGALGLVSARRRDRSRSGHITLAFPDSTNEVAADGLVQSQAGTTNRKWFSGLRLHEGSTYDSVVFATAACGIIGSESNG